jgi:Ca2+-binding RTX toxin-like protein
MPIFNGTNGVDNITGSASDDTINGLDGNDSLYGGKGNDLFNGGLGDDLIDGQDGVFDMALYTDATGAVTVNLALGAATGAAGNDTLLNIERVMGSAYGDTLTGNTGDNLFEGLAGNDTIDGGAGSDRAEYWNASSGVIVDLAAGTAIGGAGTDVLSNIENISGSQHSDVLTGDTNANSLTGFTGNDSLYGGKGNDNLTGGLGDDSIDGGDSSDSAAYYDATSGVTVNLAVGTATGGGGTDVLVSIESVNGSNFNDLLTGNSLSNYLGGGAGNDTLDGAAGNDNLAGGLGDDSLNGGADYDNIDYSSSATAAVIVNLATGTASGGDGNDVLLNIEGVSGSAFNDHITGNSGGNNLSGRDGNDTLLGGDGNDNLTGGAGDDSLDGGSGTDAANYNEAIAGVTINLAAGTVTGGSGTDSLTSIENVSGSQFNDSLTGDTGANSLYAGVGNDTLMGGDGVDTLTGGLGNDSLDGGAGTDLAQFNDGTLGVTVNLATGTASGGDGTDTLTGIENLYGSKQGDSLTGDDNANRLDAQLGNDTLQGAGGNDFLIGGLGDDSLDGGSGFDYAQYNDATAGVTVNLSAGTASGGAGNDVLAAIEYVYGSSYGDTLTGDDNANVLDGQAGNDLISGGGGQDTLIGGDGNDSLYGGTEADTLIGGAGNDTMDGGAILDRVNLNDLNFAHYLSATSGVNINLATGSVQDGQGGTDTLININFVLASNFDDTVTGSTVSNLFEQFEGGAGNDTIDGGAIDPVLQLNANRATYHSATAAVSVNLATGTATGGAGNDTLININHVRGTSYADTLIGSTTSLTEQFEGRAGNDTIDGAGGTDMVRYDSATVAVNVNLVTNLASDGLGGTDTLSNIEGIRGSGYGDTLTGGNTANGSGAIDGFEFFMGQGGNDTIDGGVGYDRADYTNSTTGVNVTLGGTSNGTASDGWGGTDTLINIEGIRASENNDTLTGSDTGAYESFEGRGGSDTIDGKGGTDRIDYQSATAGVSVNIATGTASDGYGGTDSFTNIEAARGSAFNDTLVGDANANHLTGGAGNDTLTGGASSDTFVFTTGSQDSVTDFVAGAGGDVIDIQACVASLTNFGGGDPFASGHVRLVQAGADTQLQVDSDGADSGVFQTIAVLVNVTAANMTRRILRGATTLPQSPPGSIWWARPGQTI